MAGTFFTKAASLLLLATTSYAAPASLQTRQDAQLTADPEGRCSILASMKVMVPDEDTYVYIDLYDGAGAHQGEQHSGGLYRNTAWFFIDGLPKTLWSATVTGSDIATTGGTMDIWFVYGDNDGAEPFNWLQCGVTEPLNEIGFEQRRCYFPCDKSY